MGVVLRFISTLTLFAFLLLFSFSAAASLHRFNGGVGQGKKETARSPGLPDGIVEQKKLGRSGSMPPNCRSKCGKCEPCKAVHVPMERGLIMPLEYYPAAWWCKCGGKLYVP